MPRHLADISMGGATGGVHGGTMSPHFGTSGVEGVQGAAQ